MSTLIKTRLRFNRNEANIFHLCLLRRPGFETKPIRCSVEPVAWNALLIKTSNSTQGKETHSCLFRSIARIVFFRLDMCVRLSRLSWLPLLLLLLIPGRHRGWHLWGKKLLKWCAVGDSIFVSGGRCNPWSVVYAEKQVCAVRNTTAVFQCSFIYPDGYTVKTVKWARGESHFLRGPFFFDSNNDNSLKFQYIGDKIHNCSLKIHQVQWMDAGQYAFRFITDIKMGKYTGVNGPVLQVTGKFRLT